MAARKVSVELYLDAGGQFRWRAVAANGLVVADCGEGYKNRDDCERGLKVAWKAIGEALLWGHTKDLTKESPMAAKKKAKKAKAVKAPAKKKKVVRRKK